MTHRCRGLFVALFLTGCDQPFVTPEAAGPVGLGLKATFGVAVEDCEDSLVNNSCHDDALPVRSARATSEHAAVVGIEDDVAVFRGVSVGEATGVLETAHDSFDFSFDVVEIDEQRLELVDTSFAAIYPLDAPAYLTRASLSLRHVHQAYGILGRLTDVRGSADVVIETETQARIGATRHLVEVITGTVPGAATLHTSSGLAHKVEIVTPEQIAALDLYDDGGRLTTELVIKDASYQRIRLVPLRADRRSIAGCGADQPRVTVSAATIGATVVTAGTYCAITVRRDEPGDATVTIAWGSATVTLPIQE